MGDYHEHTHEHHHDHEEHHADAPHGHDHNAYHHEHRGLHEILDILNRAELTDRARATAVRIFTILGKAEAKAHGATLETVHFHEVGAVDSIVDITAVAVCLDNLGIDEVIIPALYEGTGTVRCAHGVLPIPVPAVANIAAAEHLTLHITHAHGEYVTPHRRGHCGGGAHQRDPALCLHRGKKSVWARASVSRSCPASCVPCLSARPVASILHRIPSASWKQTLMTAPARLWAT